MSLIASLAALALTVGPAVSPPTASAWVYKDLGPAPDGSERFVAQVPSSADLASVSGGRDRAALQIRCDEKGLFVTLFWPDYVSAETYDESRVDVVLTLDGRVEPPMRMRHSTQAALLLGKDGLRLLKTLQSGKTLAARVPDFHGGQEASFPLEGLRTLYARVEGEGCS